MNRVKNPSVTRLIGSVSRIRIGRIKTFIRPINSAAIRADMMPEKETPGVR